MADIAFLLIVFFMVTTIFKLEEGLAITLPRSTAGEKIPREKMIIHRNLRQLIKSCIIRRRGQQRCLPPPINSQTIRLFIYIVSGKFS